MPRVALIPLLGPLHLRYPALNSVTLRDLLVELEPAAVAVAALEPDELRDPAWQDTFETALPLSLIPHLRRHGPEPALVGVASRDPGAEADFRRYRTEMPALAQQLQRHMQLEQQLTTLLDSNLKLDALQQDVIPLVRELEGELLRAAGDGPANDWRYSRAALTAERICALDSDGLLAVLVSLQQLPALEEALTRLGARLTALPERISISSEARERALLDQALLQRHSSDSAALLQALERLDSAEAQYARASLLMGLGRDPEALQLLEAASHGDFSRPYFLPGFLLARLGQLRDLAGDRRGATQAYRGVLALDWVPQEAADAARSGLEEPFSRTPTG